jgi:hypothetical protein
MWTTTTNEPDRLSRPSIPTHHALTACLSVFAGEGALSYMYRALCMAFGILDIVVPLLIMGLIILGNQDTCDRIFRLLRWMANRPEPPSPKSEPPAPS